MTTRLSLPLFAALSLAACGGAPTPHTPDATPGHGTPATAAPASAAAKAPGDAKVGDPTKCPVSGEDFTVEATSPNVVVDGKTYYFCCNGCRKKFEADPQKYIKKAPST